MWELTITKIRKQLSGVENKELQPMEGLSCGDVFDLNIKQIDLV
jgi:hypothetical protein